MVSNLLLLHCHIADVHSINNALHTGILHKRNVFNGPFKHSLAYSSSCNELSCTEQEVLLLLLCQDLQLYTFLGSSKGKAVSCDEGCQ
jgi:hypothetical protein